MGGSKLPDLPRDVVLPSAAGEPNFSKIPAWQPESAFLGDLALLLALFHQHVTWFYRYSRPKLVKQILSGETDEHNCLTFSNPAIVSREIR